MCSKSSPLSARMGTGEMSAALAELFCIHDVVDPLLRNNMTTYKTLSDYKADCKAKEDTVLIQESMYTRKSFITENIRNTTECYARKPCSHCKQEVIEIRRGD